jgi:hypothetical protein
MPNDKDDLDEMRRGFREIFDKLYAKPTKQPRDLHLRAAPDASTPSHTQSSQRVAARSNGSKESAT